MLDAYIYDGVRTPFGKQGGALARVRPDDLLSQAFSALVRRTSLDTRLLDDIFVGCANQGGEDSRCVARNAGLLAGLPVTLGGTVIQRNCGSGLGALVAASHALTAGEGELMLVGGVESMTRAPFVMAKSEAAFAREMRIFDSAVGARFPNPRLEKMFGADTMPQTADNLAMEYGLSREMVDQFAFSSQDKYRAADAAGWFAGEFCEVKVPGRKAGECDAVVSRDEPPRATTHESLSKLKPINPQGVTTAGNASGINDGAAAILVGNRAAGEKLGLKPRARVVASATAGVEPRIMGIGPVPSSQKALQRAGLQTRQLDAIEINEAFAAQALACMKGLGLAFGDERVNPNGGGIAIGHPLGASGARIALAATRRLEAVGGRYGLVTMCIGIGQGIAVVIERC